MADDNKTDSGEIMRRLNEVANDLRKMRGEEPVPFIKPEPPYCSFCGKGKNEVFTLLAAPSPEIYICDECVVKAQEIVDEMRKE